MINRIAIIAATTLVISASSASAQGQPSKQVVISKPVLRSMVANKPKAKTPLGARVGMLRRKSVVKTNPGTTAPTWVREIKPASAKK